MPGRISDEDIQSLRERTDVAGVVGDYTALKRAGGRLKGLCPFHQEKTPSFTVDPGKGLWHCFGCQAGGDVYAFLQQAEALTFPEAVERLARLTGYELRYEQLSPGQRKALGRRTRLNEALAEAAAFYAGELVSDRGAPARRYLAQRGVGEAEAARFGLGWAPDAWDGLVRRLRSAGFTPEEMTEAGLASEGSRGPIDRFRGRIMFPIHDKSGKDVVAFGGRVVPGVELRTAGRGEAPPKYINSAESPVYRKSEVLYGLHLARAEMQRRDTALVVEGYMDVIALHLVGVGNAVATCGTALTADHIRALEHFARRVVLALDADDAGYRAAERARQLAEEAGVREVAVLALPEGTDPADLAAEGAECVEGALAHTKTAVQFQIEHLLRDADTATPEGQVEAYRRTFPLLGRLGDRFLRYTYVRDVVAPAVRLPADRIEAELDEQLAEPVAQDPGRHIPAAAGSRTPPAPGDVAHGQPRDPQLALEREVLRASLQFPELLPSEWKLVTIEDFRSPVSRQLFTALAEAPGGDLDAILTALPDEGVRSRVRALAMSDPTVEPEPGKLAELVARLRAASVQREADAMRARMAEVSAQVDPETRRELVAGLGELERRRRELLEGGKR